MDTINWAMDHWAEIGTILGGLHFLASSITALTPTPKDDVYANKVHAVFVRLYSVIEKIALVVGKAKQ